MPYMGKDDPHGKKAARKGGKKGKKGGVKKGNPFSKATKVATGY